MAAKQYYLVTVISETTTKEVQLLEEEREILKDVDKTPKAKVMEDLICY